MKDGEGFDRISSSVAHFCVACVSNTMIAVSQSRVNQHVKFLQNKLDQLHFFSVMVRWH